MTEVTVVKRRKARGRNDKLSPDEPVIQEFIKIFGYENLEEMTDKEFSTEALRESNTVDKYREQNLREKLNKIISSSFLKKISKGYDLNDEKDLIIILRFILNRINYDLKSGQIFNARDDKRSMRYWVIKK